MGRSTDQGMQTFATALFHLEGRWWNTQGRVLFNLEPAEALARLDGVMERVTD